MHIAIEYYKSAAAKDEAIAICNLGLCYKYGRGVGQDLSYARSLFKKAMDLGYKPAKEYYESM
jgi:TPR repeat protein